MNWTQLIGGLALAGAVGAAGGAMGATAADRWSPSMITIEVTRKQYDYLQPWNQRTEMFQKTAVVAPGRQALTTAEFLNDHTVLRLQRGGRGAWHAGRLEWIDYYANLALVSVADPDFWDGLEPIVWSERIPSEGAVQIVRWRNGRIESRPGEIDRLVVRKSKLGLIEHLHLDVNSEITGAGWAEAVVREDRLLGLTVSQNGNHISVLPAPFVRPILEARAQGRFPGLGFFDFVWTKPENPQILKHLRLEGPPRGVVVIDSIGSTGIERPLRPRDVILRIDGFDIDTEGDYSDPDYGSLSLENLACRGRWAGDTLDLTVLRDGQEREIQYRLPRADYRIELLPEQIFDQPPEYLLVGGLVFVPLSEPYLHSWGSNWRRKAPFRMVYYGYQKPTPERPSLVVLSIILPDPYNLGYQDYRFLTVDRVNGRLITRLADLVDAFDHPVNGFHRIEFCPGEALQRMILDADAAPAATRRVLERYRIDQDRFLAKP